MPDDQAAQGGAAAARAIAARIGDLAVALAAWEARSEPDADARRAAGRAVRSIDNALAALHDLRQRLVSEIRQADDARAAAVDAYLAGGPGSKGREVQADSPGGIA